MRVKDFEFVCEGSNLANAIELMNMELELILPGMLGLIQCSFDLHKDCC